MSTNASSAAVSPNLQDKPMVVSKYETASSNTETEEYDMADQRDSKVFGSAAENDKILATFFDISKYKLEYDNLNECVNALFKKAKETDAANRDIKRRQRKNKEQIKILENEFKKSPDWSREFIRRISEKLGLRECQVYKWHWDQRKKEGMAVGQYLE